MTRPPPDTRRVASDVGTLRRVIVHTPGPEILKVVSALSGDHPMLPSTLLRERAAGEHESFVRLLEAEGAEVIQFIDLLDEAVGEARSAGQLRTWLQGAAPQLVPHEPEISAPVLLGAVDRFVYHQEPQGGFRPLTPPVKDVLYARDPAVMTPRGAVICNFMNADRSFETALSRLAFDWSPRLREYGVAFDAREEQVYIQGGDVIVVDEETLLVGTGNLTEEIAARKLASTLEMDVIAVQLPSGGDGAGAEMYESWHGLRSLFLHLDSIFNMVDHRRALTIPLLLEAEHAGADPLSRIASGLARTRGVATSDASKLRTHLERTGRIRRFEAGSGQEFPLPEQVKLVDYLRGEGWEIVPVGGDGNPHDLSHFVERALRELHFQAANVVATGPGRVIACAENRHTLETLRESGVEVSEFDAGEIVRWGGGPHCLTLPLERGE